MKMAKANNNFMFSLVFFWQDNLQFVPFLVEHDMQKRFWVLLGKFVERLFGETPFFD